MITTTTVALPTASPLSPPSADLSRDEAGQVETDQIEGARIEADEDARPQFDAREDRALLGTVAVIPGALLALGLGAVLTGTSDAAALALLTGHFIAQFIVLLVYGTMLMNDEDLDRAGRAMWATAFLAAAPVALPIYYWFRIHEPAPREPRGTVRELPLAHG